MGVQGSRHPHIWGLTEVVEQHYVRSSELLRRCPTTYYVTYVKLDYVRSFYRIMLGVLGLSSGLEGVREGTWGW